MSTNDIMSRIGILHLSWKRYLEAPVLREGGTLKQLYLLRKLRDLGELRPAEIADMLFCDRSTASVILSNLEKKGYLRREKDPLDGRGRIVRITPGGEKEYLRLRKLLPVEEECNPAESLDDCEKQELLRLLRKIQNNLDRR